MKVKQLIIFAVIAGCWCAELCAHSKAEPGVVRPTVTVEFDNEVQALAKGFEQAFQALPIGARYVEIVTAEGSRFLQGSAESVQALEGVVLIKMEKGLVYAISAKNIIAITNEKPGR